MNDSQNWNQTSKIKPQNNSKVYWMDSGGNVTKGTFSSNMWFIESNGMYIYYVPTFWKYQ